MRYLTFFVPDNPAGGPPDARHMAEMNALVDDQTKAGVLIVTGAMLPAANGIRLRFANAKFEVSEGATPTPAVGFAILETKTKEEVIEAVKRFLSVAGEGVCEIRPLMGPPAA